MKFIITSTSGEIPKCLGTKTETVKVFDRRCFNTPEEFEERFGKSWFSEGTEHGYWLYGHEKRISRFLGETKEIHVLEIDSLEQLLDLSDKSEACFIVGSCDRDAELPEIEIYDSYRE